MRKLFTTVWSLLLFLILSIQPSNVFANNSVPAPNTATALELVDAVNTLRASRGLPPYQINTILMTIAQQQAEYNASIHVGNADTDAQGRHPFQRALDAGYLVAGDLSTGGLFSENVILGSVMTPQQAVQAWMGNASNQGTMLSEIYKDIGTGLAIDGNSYYYCLDAGLSTGGTPVAYTPPPPLITYTPTIAMNTPNADGSLDYTVQPGDTVLTIAIAYGVSVSTIDGLNSLDTNSTIYAGQKLIIRAAFTPTPTQPTSTPTLRPTITLWPTSTATSTATPPVPTPTISPGMPVAKAGEAVVIIAVFAIICASVITLVGLINRKRK